jgi:predicted transposase YbfD/YdcC
MPWTPRSAPTSPNAATPTSATRHVGATGSAPRPAIAVDGKALSGSAHRTQRHRHLLSAVTHAPTVTLAQREVGAKTNETAAFRPLLQPLDLAGTVVTFDALHSVKDQVRWLVQEKKAHYIAVIKGNQPIASASSKPCRGNRCPWRTPSPGPVTGGGSPARSRPWPSRRTWAGSPFRKRGWPTRPPATSGERQAADPGDRLRRHQPRYPPGQPRRVGRIRARALGNRNSSHHVRDVVFAEDASTGVRGGHGRIADRFTRYEPRLRAGRSVLGPLSELLRKNCWTIAEWAGEAGPHAMQHLLCRASWDSDAVRDDVREYVVDHLRWWRALSGEAGGTVSIR